MHGSAPKLLIIAKKEVIGDDGPNFDGDDYMSAKKKMMESDGEEEPPGEDKYSDDPHMAMKEMAKELYKASKLHAGQADKLMEICEEMYSEEQGKGKSDDDEEKPHKSYGDHNPYGSAKEY
jgi:hypothetical protein